MKPLRCLLFGCRFERRLLRALLANGAAYLKWRSVCLRCAAEGPVTGREATWRLEEE